MACDPFTSSEIAGRELGKRTCLHLRPRRLTMLERRFNKTTHHPLYGEARVGISAVHLVESVDEGRGAV